MKIKNDLQLAVAISLVIALISATIVGVFDVYRRNQIADLTVNAHRNSLIAHNLSAVGSGLASLSPYFIRIELVERESSITLMSSEKSRTFIEASIYRTLMASDRSSFETLKVRFVYSVLSLIMDALLLGLLIASILSPLIYRIVRYFEKQNRLILEGTYNQRLADIAVQVAHDIRSPLSVLNVLSRKQVGDSEELLLLQAVVKRITSIADDLLNRYKSRDILAPCRTSDVIKAVVAEKSTLWGPRAEISVEGLQLADKVHVLASSADLARILSNLFENSFEAQSPERKLNLRVAVSRPTPSRLLIEIVDNGQGIPSNLISRIGARGYSTKTASKSSSGHGIGLHSASESVKSWGGMLKIESAVGCGTTIGLELAVVPVT